MADHGLFTPSCLFDVANPLSSWCGRVRTHNLHFAIVFYRVLLNNSLFSFDICDGLLMIHYFKKQTNEAFHFKKGFGFNAYLSVVVIAVINY